MSTSADQPLWTPSPDRAGASRMTAFRARFGPDDGTDLHTWSVTDPGGFWQAVWDDAEVVGDRGEGPAFTTGAHLTDARFFPDATLNYAENLLRRRGDDPAMMFRGEDGTARELSWDDLHALVSRLQAALVADGVEPGDRVAAWLPNLPETYAVMLAAASIGAVFSSVSPDFGPQGVLDRFGQIEPVVLVTTDGYYYGGKRHDVTDKVAEVAAALPTVRRVVVVPDGHGGPAAQSPDGTTPLADWLAPHPTGEPSFTRLPFDHPLYILYSSGTTGAPKCIVHRAGGLLLKHHVEYRLHCDVRPGNRVFYFTTAGWMMWNWLAAGLAAGATLVLYDGSPFHPDGTRLFDLVDEVGVSLMGVSAKFIDSVAKAGLRPADSHDLSTLRTVCSTGSPLTHEGFAHVYADWKADLHLASISGGTDLCGCLVGGDPTAPVYAGQIQGPVLGQAMAVVDDDGEPCPPGVQGELVCGAPFPSMPLGFWNDPGDERYHTAYFERFEGLWHQGDFAEHTPEGGFIIHGRSDATLNPGGVRIGTAEIYRRVEAFDEITESLVIGQSWDGDTRVVLFVVPAAGVDLDDDLRGRLRSAIRTGASPRHVPAVILAVPDLPRTRSGKLVELAVRNVVHGRPVTNVEALANPEALTHVADRPELG